MKKILSLFAAALVAVAVNAQTDFAAPGYSCAADDAVLSGSATAAPSATPQASKLCLVTADPPYLAWKDVSTSTPDNAVAIWSVTATRGCYVSVTLDLSSVIIDSNKHIFEVKIKDANGNVKGTLAEPAENADAGQQKTLDGTILLPTAGVYTVELRNNRSYGKGAVLNVILTYAADAPSEIIDVASVELNKTAVTLDLQEVELLEATVSPDNATDPTVTWETSDAAVATINENGLILAVAAGTATITATAGEQSATCTVTVAAAAIPDVNFNDPYVLAGKVAHLEGAIWKNEAYKLYGDGGHNQHYGNALWTINVTRPCVVSGALNGVEGGHLFELDLYKGEEFVATIAHSEDKKWSAGEIALEGTLTFAEAGAYTLKLRNTQEWSSGKVASVTLTFVEDYVPAEPQPAEAQLWKVTPETPYAANSTLIDDDLMQLASVYLSFVSGTNHTYGEEVFAKAFQIRAKNAPTEDNLTGEENETTDDTKKASPLVLTAKEDIEVTFYYRQQQTAETPAAENDNKDLWIYDQDAITAKLTGTHTSVDVSDDSKYAFVTKKMTFTKNHVYTLTAVGTTLPLFGLEYKATEGETTALTNTETSAKAVKKMVNGILIIEKAGVKYNVLGTAL